MGREISRRYAFGSQFYEKALILAETIDVKEYLIDIYYTLTKALGKDIEPKFGPDRKGDIKHSNADISKAKRLLGYDPQYDFIKGLAQAIEWYKVNL